MRGVLALLVLAAALAGCGGEGRAGDGEQATLWVTRDRGATLLHDEPVPAGETALRALDHVADVDTRYGGRFVQAVDGIEGSLEGGQDWFLYVNGYLADRGGAEYRLREGTWSGGTTATGTEGRSKRTGWRWAHSPSRSSTGTAARRGLRS